jgi:cytochrome c peroxidase
LHNISFFCNDEFYNWVFLDPEGDLKRNLRPMARSLLSSLLVVFGLITITSCVSDLTESENLTDSRLKLEIGKVSPTGSIDYFSLPDPDDLDVIPQDPRNRLTPAKVQLGKFLFFETGLAIDARKPEGLYTYSCGSCHVPTAGFMPGRMQGIADGGMGFGYNGEERTKLPSYHESEIDAQGARPLSLLNAAYVKNAFWNGQFGGGFANEGTEHLWNEEDETDSNFLGLGSIESQAIPALEIHRMVVNKQVTDTYGYTEYFDRAFPDITEEQRYTKQNAGMALAAYIRTLLPNQAPFQKWLKGDKQSMTEQQKRGAILFFSKANCTNCHNSPGLNSTTFHAIGVKDLYQTGGLATSADDRRNLGRGGFTKQERDYYKFKVPQLYNLKTSPFYFHGSSKRSLKDVVEYFNRAIPENENVPEEQLSPFFQPLNLTHQEVEDLTEFLKHGLYDDNLERFMPEEILSGFCFPNNDPRSAEDMGCN